MSNWYLLISYGGDPENTVEWTIIVHKGTLNLQTNPEKQRCGCWNLIFTFNITLCMIIPGLAAVHLVSGVDP
jgi:hypothetical protein